MAIGGGVTDSAQAMTLIGETRRYYGRIDVIELGRKGTSRYLTPAGVELAYPKPPCDGHRAYFGGSIRFGAPRHRLILKSADLERPLPGHHAELLEITPALAETVREFDRAIGISDQTTAS